MPRVHLVKKSRKDYPGIPKGSTYYWWKFRYGGMHRSLIRPRQSQLTQSSHLSEAYSIQEDLEALIIQDIKEGIDLQEYADRIRELGQNAEDSLYNMPDGLQQGDVGQMLEQRTSDMEDWANELEGVDTEIDEDQIHEDARKDAGSEFNLGGVSSKELFEEMVETRTQEILEEIQDISANACIE